MANAKQPTRKAVQTKVVNLRDKKQLAWAVIGQEVGVAPRTARRLYDEVKGAGAHVGLLPGKGGRRPVVKVQPKAKPAAKATKAQPKAKATKAA